MSLVNKVIRKEMIIRPSGRSSDYITPSFGYGCLLNCTYCYMKRHKDEGLTIARNTNDILTEINNHAFFDTTNKPNQTDPKYVTYDISCNEDFALHINYHEWTKIFDFFKEHPIAKATFATKMVKKELLEYDPEGKVRIRFSLMPQKMSSIVEPRTSTIKERLEAINDFKKAGYDVHVNFSPVIVYKNWLQDYEELFHQLNDTVEDHFKDDVLAEVIFLTHNEEKHLYNLEKRLPGEQYLWTPHNQEPKNSQYGGRNIRYSRNLKNVYVDLFKESHKEIVPWNKIRYIF